MEVSTCGKILLQTVPNKISDSIVILKPTEEDVKKKKLKKSLKNFSPGLDGLTVNHLKAYLYFFFTYYNGFFE